MALDNCNLSPSLSTRFDDNILNQIADLAAALTPISDMAALLDINLSELRYAIAMPDSPVRNVYLKAKAKTALALRRQEIDLANVGSPLAVQMTNIYLHEMDQEESEL